MEHNDYGKFGEKKAKQYLIKNKYKILCTNYDNGYGEIDIIAVETKKSKKKKTYFSNMTEAEKSDEVIVFIEVKARNSTAFGEPFDAVDKARQERYYVSSQQFLNKYDLTNVSYRYDIIEIIGTDSINHIENAF